MRSRQPFAQDQQRRRPKNEHKKEQLIPHDRSQNGHFRLTRRQPARLAQLMQAGKRQLKRNEHQDDARRGEKPVQRNAQCALEKEKTNRDRGTNPHNRPDPGLQAFARKLHGAQNQRQFRPFAQDHQENKKENPPARRAPRLFRVGLHLGLDVFFQVARNAVHPYDHRNNEDRSDE